MLASQHLTVVTEPRLSVERQVQCWGDERKELLSPRAAELGETGPHLPV